MCCIFTCCGWMVDLIQRAWVFAMSCCISSAVCCTLVTASMSGVALGYNYSMAEYIDLKETNVSVYLKRGIFDDEIADDMDWRRAGRMPVAGLIKEDKLMTAPSNEGDKYLRSGRRLDDSIIESNDHNRFEGSLMKLTAIAPEQSTTTGFSTDNQFLENLSEFPNDIDKLKQIQGIINEKKSKALSALRRAGNVNFDKKTSELQHIDRHYLANQLEPGPSPYLGQSLPADSGRRMMTEKSPNLPQYDVGAWDHQEIFRKLFTTTHIIVHATPLDQPLPVPVTPVGPIRPTRVKVGPVRTQWQDQSPYRRQGNMSPKLRTSGSKEVAQNEEDYDHIEGLPVRNKRNTHIDFSKSIEDKTLKSSRLTSREKEIEESKVIEKVESQTKTSFLEQKPNVDRRMNYVLDTDRLKGISLNPLRYAVPDAFIGRPELWSLPHRRPEYPDIRHYIDPFGYEMLTPTLPSPVTPKSPIRPRVSTPRKPTSTQTRSPTQSSLGDEPSLPKSIDDEMETDPIRQKLLLSKLGPSRIKQVVMKKTEEDYEEENKGLPVRRKRSIYVVSEHKTNHDLKENNAQDNNIFERTFVNKLFALFGKGTFESKDKQSNRKKSKTTETTRYVSKNESTLYQKLTTDKFFVIQSTLT